MMPGVGHPVEVILNAVADEGVDMDRYRFWSYIRSEALVPDINNFNSILLRQDVIMKNGQYKEF
ncbi:MAG TPA: hypothetical protein ENI58_02155 [Nitrospirae bacterium]|nr:hypothetical protein [Nitrospirota bacterium]